MNNVIRPRLRPGTKWELLIETVKELSIDNSMKLLKGEGTELGTGFFVERDREIRRLKSQIKDVNQKYNHVLKDFEELTDVYNDFLFIEKGITPEPIILSSDNPKLHEATAFSIWSDWHLGSTVKKEKVQGMNEYNPDIAKRRAGKMVYNLNKLILKERKNVVIKNLVIHLGGDFITNYIHEELSQTNSMSPVEETKFASELLISSIDYLLKNANLEKIVLLCNVGNHGRTTRKMTYNNLTEMSYETLIYDNIAKAFRSDSRLEISFPESGIGYYEIYGKKLRHFHGHQVRYTSGIGGLHIPLTKILMRWDKTIKADYNSMGHWHTFSHPTSNTLLNGSLIGFDAYAAENGFEYQPALQAFALFDSKFGRTITTPIFCE